MSRTIVRWLVTAATVLAVVGCQDGAATGTGTQSLPEMVQSFIVDFARQALAAFLL
jgi:hypothetical protein